MSVLPSAASGNRLLASLPRQELVRMLGICTPVELSFAEVLAEPGLPIRHVWFPTGCAIAQVVLIEGRASLEVGLVGDEGVLGVPVVLDVPLSPERAVVQVPGLALRADAARFREELTRCPVLGQVLHHYVHALMGQLAQTAGCTRYHVVEQRLARWLLMTQDRAHGDRFRVTHEFLAYILGVRRVGVTRAATALQQRRIIRYARGDITILDRDGLSGAACTCYEADRTRYALAMAASSL